MEEKDFETVIPENIKPVEPERIIELSLGDTLDLKEVIEEVKEKESE